VDSKLIQVGKKGVTPEILSEIKLMLRKYSEVKVKLLKSSRKESDRRELAGLILGHVRCKRSELRGNILTLERE